MLLVECIGQIYQTKFLLLLWHYTGAGSAALAQSAEPVRVPPPAGLLRSSVPGEGSLPHRAGHHVSAQVHGDLINYKYIKL